MVLRRVAAALIRRAERRLGVELDYVHEIGRIDPGLLARYNRLFAFLDPNRKVPPEAYHAARLRGALAADCGTCVEAEIGLARRAGLAPELIDRILAADHGDLPDGISAVIRLSDTVVRDRIDDPGARKAVRTGYGEAGLVELAFAMNGAALPPGIKRAMGYATACDLEILRKRSRRNP